MTQQVVMKRDGQIAVIHIDNPPVNVLSQAVRRELRDAITDAASDEAVRSVVLIADGKTFASGADLNEFDTGVGDPDYGDVFNAIEALDRPVVAALHGTVLGAGVELALACHYRIAAAGTLLGMPEITLGIVPGAGGTQRLPRLVGVEHALELLLSGKPISAKRAHDIGLVDEVAGGTLEREAIEYARRVARNGASPRRTADLAVERVGDDVFAITEKSLGRNLNGRTTPSLMIDAVRAAIDQPFQAGLRREAELSTASLEQPESKALRHLFFATRQTARIPGMPEHIATRPVERVGIVGSGTMGSGIAIAFANAGLPVTLLDMDRETTARGLERIEKSYQSAIKRGRLAEEDRAKRMAMIRGTAEYAELGDADVIIEAVLEKMTVKQEVFRTLDREAKAGAILATNTSTLDVDELAQVTSRPGDVIGLHFFSPANVMRLMEIVRAERTADDVVTTAFALAKRIGKVGVLSRVAYGFIGNRIMDPYAREAERAVLEGASPAQVDAALEAFGMAMGILAVFDLAGVDVGVLTRHERGASLPDDPTYYRCSELLFERGWLGQKTGQGFYRYEGRERLPHPEAETMFREEARRLGVPQRTPDTKEIQQRCLYAMVNEGAKVLEEGIALRAADIDVTYAEGYGFPRYRGGPMYWADSVGLQTILDGIRDFAARFGEQHWTPSALLVELARSGRGFHDWQP